MRLRKKGLPSPAHILEVSELSKDPYRNAKKLVSAEGYRIRIGDFRVIYRTDENMLLILVVKVGHMGEHL